MRPAAGAISGGVSGTSTGSEDSPRGWRALLETTKPGITKLVTFTSMIGFAMSAAVRGGVEWSAIWTLAWMGAICLVGTLLSAAGANSINQYMERERDARMPRTVRRPLPTGRASPRAVLWSGIALSIAGCALLLTLGVAPAAVSLACVISYVAAYTPLKTRTTLNTFIGAIPGALPPLIGWAAAGGGGWGPLAEIGGWSLFVLMFVWQIPHFMAIAWMYRDDYASGGYAMLPVVDPTLRWTSATIAMWSVAMVPAAMLPGVVMPTVLGWPYLLVAGVTSVVVMGLGVRLIRRRTRSDARALFFGTILQLPVLLVSMLAEGMARAILL